MKSGGFFFVVVLFVCLVAILPVSEVNHQDSFYSLRRIIAVSPEVRNYLEELNSGDQNRVLRALTKLSRQAEFEGIRGPGIDLLADKVLSFVLDNNNPEEIRGEAIFALGPLVLLLEDASSQERVINAVFALVGKEENTGIKLGINDFLYKLIAGTEVAEGIRGIRREEIQLKAGEKLVEMLNAPEGIVAGMAAERLTALAQAGKLSPGVYAHIRNLLNDAMREGRINTSSYVRFMLRGTQNEYQLPAPLPEEFRKIIYDNIKQPGGSGVGTIVNSIPNDPAIIEAVVWELANIAMQEKDLMTQWSAISAIRSIMNKYKHTKIGSYVSGQIYDMLCEKYGELVQKGEFEVDEMASGGREPSEIETILRQIRENLIMTAGLMAPSMEEDKRFQIAQMCVELLRSRDAVIQASAGSSLYRLMVGTASLLALQSHPQMIDPVLSLEHLRTIAKQVESVLLDPEVYWDSSYDVDMILKEVIGILRRNGYIK